MPHKKNFIFCILLLTTLSFSAFAQQWTLFALKDHQVTSLVIQNTFMAAGTDKGLFAKAQPPEWHQVPLDSSTNLPVLDIKISDQTQIAIAAGNGTEEDAIFSGHQVWGPPYYGTKIIGRFPNAQSVTATVGRGTGDTLYAGGGNIVKMSIRDSAGFSYGKLQPVKIPPYSFGVEMPVCAALHCWTFNSQLFAGGFDRSINPGPGYLLCMRNDSLNIIKTLDITAIAEGEMGDVIQHNIFFAAKDSGFYYTNAVSSQPPQRYMETPNNEPVNDFFIVSGTIVKPAKFFVAVKNGVYMNGSGIRWVEIGDIPTVPFCLFYLSKTNSSEDSLLFAGTSDGIYVLDLPVATKQITTHPKQNIINVYKGQNGKYLVTFTLDNPSNVSIDLFDCKGRCVGKLVNDYKEKGAHTIPLLNDFQLADNHICLLRMRTNGMECKRRFLFIEK